MSHDMPNIPDTKKEAPEALRVFMQRNGKFEATPEEIEEFKNLLTLPFEELEVEQRNLKVEVEEIVWELIDATGARLEELDVLNKQVWRRLAVCGAAITAKHLGEIY